MTDDVPRIRELDFSEFHDLVHLVGSRTCRTQPGGVLRHVELAWEFRWWPNLRRWTFCRIGRHRWVRWFRHDPPGGPVVEETWSCADCELPDGSRR